MPLGYTEEEEEKKRITIVIVLRIKILKSVIIERILFAFYVNVIIFILLFILALTLDK